MLYPDLEVFVDMWEERHDDGGKFRREIERAQRLSCCAFSIIMAISSIALICWC
jgi:hypothetical protein